MSRALSTSLPRVLQENFTQKSFPFIIVDGVVGNDDNIGNSKYQARSNPVVRLKSCVFLDNMQNSMLHRLWCSIQEWL